MIVDNQPMLSCTASTLLEEKKKNKTKETIISDTLMAPAI
jgi:hypothetical protein